MSSFGGDLRDDPHMRHGNGGRRRRDSSRRYRRPRDLEPSTNPFDSDCSSADDAEPTHSSDDDNNNFFDCRVDGQSSDSLGDLDEVPPVGTSNVVDEAGKERKERVAPLDFGARASTEAPALRFDGGGAMAGGGAEAEFVSPLESALARGGLVSPSNHGDDEDDDDEAGDEDYSADDEPTTALLPQHESGGWWSRIADKLSPVATTAAASAKSPSESDEMSFQSAKSIEPFVSADSNELFPDIMAEVPGGDERVRFLAEDRGRSEAPQHQENRPVPGSTHCMGSEGSRLTESSNRRASRKKKKRRRRTPLENEDQIVLKEIRSHATDSEFTLDYHSPGTPWTKVIILEEMGTASSWIILLLPYVAFLVSLALDSVLQDVAIGPLSGKEPCVQSMASESSCIFPLVPVPQRSCSYPYNFRKGEGLLSYINRNNEVVDRQYRFFMGDGVALTSGPVCNVPAMSTVLYGDVSFTNLSSDAVALVTQGTVLTSTAVFQRKDRAIQIAIDEGTNSEGSDDGSRFLAEGEEEWFPVSISKPSRLKMVCTYGKASELWNCTSPRLVDVLFSLPGTAVLTGGDIRVETLFSHYSDIPMPSDIWDRRLLDESSGCLGDRHKRKLTTDNDHSAPLVETLLFDSDLSNPEHLVSELSTSAAYILSHQRPAYSQLIVVTRLVSLAVSFCFLVYWVWRMGFVAFCCAKRAPSHEGSDGSPSDHCFGSCGLSIFWSGRRQEEEGAPIRRKNQGISWWESPWIVMPERRYLLILLLCLLMVQNPLLAVAYYHPALYSSVRMHIAADCLIGIGVHGILMLSACLLQGLRYHTAAFNRKRARQQRKVLELQRTAKFLAKEGHPNYGANSPVSSYTASYYDLYGDIDGSGFGGGLNSRLRHDPCGDGWADFLLVKLMVLSIGAASVIVSAISRFPGSTAVGRKGPSFDVTAATISRGVLQLYKTMYVVSSFVQFGVLVVWTMKIGFNVVVTGAALKKEPFLSTRPAQLAFRVLTSIVLLGLLVVVVPVAIESLMLLEKWTGGSRHPSSHGQTEESEVVHSTSSGYYHIEAQPSALEALVRVVTHATSRFPYSGTAASIGPGKILYVTVCSLVAAFIFLPASIINDDDADSTENKSQAELDREHQRSDKRHVVTLARYTNSWRVFPLPIRREAVLKQQAVPSKILPPDAFELDVFGRQGLPNFGRGIMYEGRYMPVFCLEIACWLLESSWQAYYSHDEFRTDDWAPGRMSLDSVGLKLEAAIHDETFDTHAFVCSNVCHQVDGEKDSIIVVAFRGTVTKTNMRTDLKLQQTPLPFISGRNEAAFQIRLGSKGHEVDGNSTDAEAPSASLLVPRSLDGDGKSEKFAPKAILKATPIARQALPCIHEGFLEAYLNIRDEVLRKVIELFQCQINKAVENGRSRIKCNEAIDIPTLNMPKVYITGHSLGGALGQLLALDLACNCEVVIEQPTVPNGDAQKEESPTTTSAPTGRRRRTRTSDFLQTTELLAAVSGTGGNNQSCETPVLKRRNSFPQRHTNRGEERKTSDGSRDFIHAILSGSAFNRRKGQPVCLQPPIAVYTFGQPRVGNHAFARLYKQRVPHTFRVVNERDALTSLPKAICCGGLYKHAGLDVVLDEGCTGNILVGPTVVETMFRFSKMRTSASAHSMENYRDNLESALSENELQEYYQGHGGKGRSLADSSGHGSKLNLPDWVTKVKRSSTRES